MFIGSALPAPEANPPHGDPAVTLIFPAVEHWIPEDLNQALRKWRRGAWACAALTAPRMLRLELLQASHPNLSFQETLREVWQTGLFQGCVTGSLPSSAALAQARARFPTCAWERLFRHTVALAPHLPLPSLQPRQRLLGIDGTPLTVPNTPTNRAAFGFTRHQHGDAYYPQAQAVWVSQVLSGHLLAEHLGPLREGDETVAPRLLPAVLRPADVLLGDAHFGNYPILAITQAAGAYFLVRAPGPLDPDAHVTHAHAPDDADLLLPRTPYIQDKYGALQLPAQLALRSVRFAIPKRDELNRVEQADFLTNLPRHSFSVPALRALATHRWNHETFNNDIKTRLGLGDLRSLTPWTVRHEVWAHLCLNNLVRLLQHQAYPEHPLNCSFTAACSALRQANFQLRLHPQSQASLWATVQHLLLAQPVAHRPGRTEPRMKRPDHRPYPIFKTPRAEWRAQREGR